MKNLLVVANGTPPSLQLINRLMTKNSQLIAVDGGLHSCIHLGYEPQLIIGDFDSISKEEQKKYAHLKQVHTPDQEKSDLEKALTYLFNEGATNITVCGATGKRLDHTLNNLHLLARYPGALKFETDTEVSFALHKKSTVVCQMGQTFSLIPLTPCIKVFTHGLKWELKGETLEKKFLSISNICLQREITISFESGDLIAFLMHGSETHDLQRTYS